MKQTYYYIDNNGVECKYVGQIYDIDGEAYGMITNHNAIIKQHDLIYHPEIKKVDGYNSYFTDINNNIYNGKAYKENNSYYYITTNTENVELNYHPIVAENIYYTYTLNGKICKYNGKVQYNEVTNTYTGIL